MTARLPFSECTSPSSTSNSIQPIHMGHPDAGAAPLHLDRTHAAEADPRAVGRLDEGGEHVVARAAAHDGAGAAPVDHRAGELGDGAAAVAPRRRGRRRRT